MKGTKAQTVTMETFLPKAETVMRNAYSDGVYDHPGLTSVCASRELLLREHVATCLYWFGGQDPLQTHLFHRRDEMLPTPAERAAYRAHFRSWGQNMTQARIEGLAVRKGIREYIRPGSTVKPPAYFYPTIGLDFVMQNSLPEKCATWQKYPQEQHTGVYGRLYDQTAIRAREVICLLTIFGARTGRSGAVRLHPTFGSNPLYDHRSHAGESAGHAGGIYRIRP